MIRKSFEVGYIDEDDCETPLDALGQAQLVESHLYLERRGSRRGGPDQRTLLPGPAASLPDTACQADTMTDGPKDAHP